DSMQNMHFTIPGSGDEHPQGRPKEESMNHLQNVSLSRRGLLAGSAATAAAAMAGTVPGGTAWAKAPMTNTQAPYFYRFKIGSIEATVVSDGPLPLGEPAGSFLGTSK